jgi:pimeloyl-ACP methyl ester carboxylesterase
MLARRHIEFVGQNRDEDAAAAFIGYWTSPTVWRELAAPMRTLVVASMPRVAAEWRMLFDATDDPDWIRGTQMPTQLILGNRTTAATRRVMSHLRTALPEASYVELDGAGHMSLYSHAAVLAGHVRRLVSSVAGYRGQAA